MSAPPDQKPADASDSAAAAEVPAPRPPGLAGLAQDMVESDAAFRAQFDPSSESHHGGDKTAVPANDAALFGGGRVPDSMGGDAAKDWAALPEAPPAQEDFGPEVELLMKSRTELGTLKKALNDVCTAATVLARAAADKKDESLEALKVSCEKARASVELLKERAASLAEQGYTTASEKVGAQRWAEAVTIVTTKALDEKSHTVEGAQELTVASKPHTSAIFNAQSALLQEIKAAKKRKADADAKQ